MERGEERLLARSNADLLELAAVASHDLQEPLRKITAFGELLRNRAGQTLDEESRDYLSRMQSAARRMSKLIGSLLDLASITSRGKPFDAVALREVVEEVVGDLEVPLADGRGRIEVGWLPVIDADRLQMRQLFQNLLGNALKFASPDRPPVVSVTSARAGDGRWSICVTDNGIGFDESLLDRLFKPFSRLNPLSMYEGSGMGLAICRTIMARHRGEIRARSTAGAGSAFTVVVPERAAREGSRPSGPLREGSTR